MYLIIREELEKRIRAQKQIDAKRESQFMIELKIQHLKALLCLATLKNQGQVSNHLFRLKNRQKTLKIAGTFEI